jgi:hypothetical protein
VTREPQVRAALSVLGGPPRLREVYKTEIKRALDDIDAAARFHEMVKTPKKKLESHIKALRRMRNSLPYPDAAFAETLTRRIAQFEKQAAPPPKWASSVSRRRATPIGKSSLSFTLKAC